MDATEALLRNAEFWHATFDRGGLAVEPSLRLAIVTCMDSRLNPYAMFGLREGQAHMVRNAGGIVTDDVIRSLTLSQRFLGTREIIVIMHTDCGLLKHDEETFREILTEQVGVRPSWAVGAIRDLHAEVRTALTALRESPFLLHRDRIRGFVYDVDTGALDEVV